MHSAVVDDKGCGDSISCLCLGLAMTLYGRHCQVKGSYSLKEDRHSFVWLSALSKYIPSVCGKLD